MGYSDAASFRLGTFVSFDRYGSAGLKRWLEEQVVVRLSRAGRALLILSAVRDPTATGNECFVVRAARNDTTDVLGRKASVGFAAERHPRRTRRDEFVIAPSSALGSCRRTNPGERAVGSNEARAAGEVLCGGDIILGKNPEYDDKRGEYAAVNGMHWCLPGEVPKRTG